MTNNFYKIYCFNSVDQFKKQFWGSVLSKFQKMCHYVYLWENLELELLSNNLHKNPPFSKVFEQLFLLPNTKDLFWKICYILHIIIINIW